jgi:hypothetical protein
MSIQSTGLSRTEKKAHRDTGDTGAAAPGLDQSSHGGVGSFSVDQFCKAHGICRATLYNLWRAGRGPKFMQLGAIRRIPHDAALAWQREQCERREQCEECEEQDEE